MISIFILKKIKDHQKLWSGVSNIIPFSKKNDFRDWNVKILIKTFYNKINNYNMFKFKNKYYVEK